ncbi:hypothetical protein [Brevibacillus sp. HD1.4A]|uniref:hypothetical protein n=1 Tax=Brevibacillus sp. HD1.4A TaxID=2738978 RepID=UPI00352E4B6A
MREQRMTLWAASEQIVRSLGGSLRECGIDLASEQTGLPPEGVDGFLVTGHDDYNKLRAADRTSMRQQNDADMLVIYGDEAPYAWADELALSSEAGDDARKWEVIRLALWSGNERALIGGDPSGKHMRLVCRLLAEYGKVSMICGCREVDEAIRQLPRYLAWKERFYWELGEWCDTRQVSLRQVSRALGLDTRIGQGWLFAERRDHSHVCKWLERECQLVLEKAKVRRVALIGSNALWDKMPQGWLAKMDVAVYTGADGQYPNEVHPDWLHGDSWNAVLQDADLLVIGDRLGIVDELSLQEVAKVMRQSLVVDAASCFPTQEAQLFFKGYRAIGEKTNVWE